MAWLLAAFIAAAWTTLYVAYHDKAWVETECCATPTVAV